MIVNISSTFSYRRNSRGGKTMLEVSVKIMLHTMSYSVGDHFHRRILESPYVNRWEQKCAGKSTF